MLKEPTRRIRFLTLKEAQAFLAALPEYLADMAAFSLAQLGASWHVQNGTPLFALQEFGGWASTDMVRRYAHLAGDHLAPYAERLCALRAVEEQIDGTNTAQP